MRIVVNGIPKSGTHATLKAVYLNRPQRGAWAAEHGHFPSPEVDPFANKHVLTVRNPRNNIISMLRMMEQPITEARIVKMIRYWMGGDESFNEYAMRYAPYLADGATHVVRYEQLLADPAVIRGICDFVGYAYVDDTFEHLPVSWTATNNRVKSDWREHWTPAIDLAWADSGLEWEKLLGYDNG